MVPLLAYTPLAVAGGTAVFVIALLLRRRAPRGARAAADRRAGGDRGAARARRPERRRGRRRAAAARDDREPVPSAAGRPQRGSSSSRRERPDVLSLQEVTPARRGGARRGRAASPAPRAGAGRARAAGFGSAVYARVPLERAPIAGRPDGRPRHGSACPAPRRWRCSPCTRASRSARRTCDEWRADLRALPPATRAAHVRIIAGDFNATLDHAELRRVLDRGYEDAADEMGHGLRATWPSNRRSRRRSRSTTCSPTSAAACATCA